MPTCCWSSNPTLRGKGASNLCTASSHKKLRDYDCYGEKQKTVEYLRRNKNAGYAQEVAPSERNLCKAFKADILKIQSVNTQIDPKLARVYLLNGIEANCRAESAPLIRVGALFHPIFPGSCGRWTGRDGAASPGPGGSSACPVATATVVGDR